MMQAQRAVDSFLIPNLCVSTDNGECFKRAKGGNGIREVFNVRKNIFMATLTEEDVSGKISMGKMTFQEMLIFFQGLEAVLRCGNLAERSTLRNFLGSKEFRLKGNAKLREFIKKTPEIEAGISKEILEEIKQSIINLF